MDRDSGNKRDWDFEREKRDYKREEPDSLETWRLALHCIADIMGRQPNQPEMLPSMITKSLYCNLAVELGE